MNKYRFAVLSGMDLLERLSSSSDITDFLTKNPTSSASSLSLDEVGSTTSAHLPTLTDFLLASSQPYISPRSRPVFSETNLLLKFVDANLLNNSLIFLKKKKVEKSFAPSLPIWILINIDDQIEKLTSVLEQLKTFTQIDKHGDEDGAYHLRVSFVRNGSICNFQSLSECWVPLPSTLLNADGKLSALTIYSSGFVYDYPTEKNQTNITDILDQAIRDLPAIYSKHISFIRASITVCQKYWDKLNRLPPLCPQSFQRAVLSSNLTDMQTQMASFVWAQLLAQQVLLGNICVSEYSCLCICMYGCVCGFVSVSA